MKSLILKTQLVVLILITSVIQLLASPGGKIIKEIFDSPLGKIILILLVIIFLPLIIYSQAKEFIGIRKTRKDLKELSRINPDYFDEISLRNRMTDIFTRVHKAWSNEDLDECKEFMSNWYWQNQQVVYLDKWKEENIENICNVKRVNSIAPLHLRINESENYEGSRIMMKIEANMEDYLRDKSTKKIVEGKVGYKDVETVWTISLNEGNWKVDNIEQSEMTLRYAKMENILPTVNTTTRAV